MFDLYLNGMHLTQEYLLLPEPCSPTTLSYFPVEEPKISAAELKINEVYVFNKAEQEEWKTIE